MIRPATIALATALIALAAPPAAQAAPTAVSVRVEGAATTLFEGPLLTDGHAVRATSDTRAHRCDGRNNGAHASAGPTPTAAAADAMALSNSTFGAKWFPGYDDYFLERFGPDAQTSSAYWGILVDGAFTPVGGCQFQLSAADEVLWAYDAFNSRPFLRLSSAGAALVAPDAPLQVQVTQSNGGSESGAPLVLAPAGGVAVAPVTTAVNGVETAHPSDPASVVTAGGGTATLTFHTPGWHRVKATAAGFVRSNRLDVCVPAAPATDCGPLPADAQLRIPPAPPGDPGPEPDPDPGPLPGPDPPQPPVVTPPQPPTVPSARLRAPRVIAAGAREGRISVEWAVLDPGPGIRGWTIASRTLGRRGAAWVVRASGSSGTSARLALPAGGSQALRLTVVDTLGCAASAAIGTVLVPRDDRGGELDYRGAWKRIAARDAWRGTLTRGGAGAKLRVRLDAGTPALFVRPDAHGARVDVWAGGRRQLLRIAPGRGRRIVRAARRSHGGVVRMRVRDGQVALDGVAVAP